MGKPARVFESCSRQLVFFVHTLLASFHINTSHIFESFLTSFGAGLSWFFLSCTLLQYEWQKHCNPVTSYLCTEMLVHRNSITLTFFLSFLGARNKFGQLFRAKRMWKSVKVAEARQDHKVYMSESLHNYLWLSNGKAHSNAFFTFLLFLLLAETLSWQNCAPCDGRRDITGSGYLRQLSSQWRLKYQHKAGGNKWSPIANINKGRDCVHS